jgi:GT2 family glycosyltransferase
MKLSIVVVKYGRDVDSLPCISEDLGSHPSVELILVDNSESPDDRAVSLYSEGKIRYQWMGGNKGISAAFNQGIALASVDSTHVCFLDQDTAGVGAYIATCIPHLEADQADVYMPLVMSGDTILSPCRRVGLWYRPLRNTGRLPESFSFINSGLIINKKTLEHVRFDESLFLDFVDHQMALDLSRAGARFSPLWQSRLEQDYSRETDSRLQALRRFAIFKRDAQRFYGNNLGGRIWAILLVSWRAARATLRYRSMDFLRRGSWS